MCDPYDHIAPRGLTCIRQLCEGFLEDFPQLGGDDDDHEVASVRWLCEVILQELDWEEHGEAAAPPGPPPAGKE
jgi:hypothetical protein